MIITTILDMLIPVISCYSLIFTQICIFPKMCSKLFVGDGNGRWESSEWPAARSISFQCDLPRHEWNDDNHHKVQPGADPRLNIHRKHCRNAETWNLSECVFLCSISDEWFTLCLQINIDQPMDFLLNLLDEMSFSAPWRVHRCTLGFPGWRCGSLRPGCGR